MFRLLSIRSLLPQLITRKRLLSKKVQGRFTDVIPVTLFRISGESRRVILREKAVQLAKGSRMYDLTLDRNGLVQPAPLTNVFIGPNGASLRSAGINLWDLLAGREGITNILEIPKGSKIPKKLVLLHEMGDHYSLQCAEPMKRADLEYLINDFFKDFPFYSSERYFEKYPLD